MKTIGGGRTSRSEGKELGEIRFSWGWGPLGPHHLLSPTSTDRLHRAVVDPYARFSPCIVVCPNTSRRVPKWAAAFADDSADEADDDGSEPGCLNSPEQPESFEADDEEEEEELGGSRAAEAPEGGAAEELEGGAAEELGGQEAPALKRRPAAAVGRPGRSELEKIMTMNGWDLGWDDRMQARRDWIKRECEEETGGGRRHGE
eukprot:9491287-Pyramimonas_sp.AAC.1